MEGNFGKLHEALSATKEEMKHEIQTVKLNINSVEKSVEKTMDNCGRRNKGSQRY